jgi:integrase
MSIDVDNDPLIIKFVEEKQKSTKIRLKRYIRHYCNFRGKNPTELIKEADEESKKDIPRWEIAEYDLRDILKEFKEYLEIKDYSERTVKENIIAVKSFYNFRQIVIPKTNFKYRQTDTADKVVKTVEDLPGEKEIRQALTFANPLVKAIILVMISSGMDASTVTSLRVKDFVEGLKDMAVINENGLLDIDKTREKVNRINGPIVIWNVRRQKLGLNGQDHTTFSTPEAIMAILFYLEYHFPPSFNGPLFRTLNGKKITKGLFSYYFRELNRKCNFGMLGRFIYFRSHNLRKFFANQMDIPMGRPDTDYMMGHLREKNRVSGTYFKPDINTLRLKYKQNMNKLSVTEEVTYREVNDERLQELEELEKRKEKKLIKLENELNEFKEKTEKLMANKEFLRDMAE